RLDIFEEGPTPGKPQTEPLFFREGIVHSFTTVTSLDLPLEPGLRYFWSVTGSNAVGATVSNGGTAWPFFTVSDAPLGAFSFIAPDRDGASMTLTPSLSWTSSPNARDYRVEIFPSVNGVLVEPAVVDVTVTATNY